MILSRVVRLKRVGCSTKLNPGESNQKQFVLCKHTFNLRFTCSLCSVTQPSVIRSIPKCSKRLIFCLRFNWISSKSSQSFNPSLRHFVYFNKLTDCSRTVAIKDLGWKVSFSNSFSSLKLHLIQLLKFKYFIVKLWGLGTFPEINIKNIMQTKALVQIFRYWNTLFTPCFVKTYKFAQHCSIFRIVSQDAEHAGDFSNVLSEA